MIKQSSHLKNSAFPICGGGDLFSRRRLMLTGLVAALPTAGLANPCDNCSEQLRAAWERYKSRFLRDDGRIVDTYNDGISHSEGQGFAMRIAVAMDDREAFDRIWFWTQSRLKRRDGLFIWRMKPGSRKHNQDQNNASDGDLFIAWALMLAGDRWAEASYYAQGRAVFAAMEAHLLVEIAGATVFLPARFSFERADGYVLNLSYFVFPALKYAAQMISPRWGDVYQSGVYLLDAARFGAFNLPADWIFVSKDGVVSLATDFPPRFGYDAIRVPLYAIWGGVEARDFLSNLEYQWDRVSGRRTIPDWIDVKRNKISKYEANQGIQMVRRLVQKTLYARAIPDLVIESRDDYYAASLKLLSGLAALKQ